MLFWWAVISPSPPAIIRLLAPKSAFIFGIQTEQFFDADGRELWGKPRNKKTINRVLRNLSFVDAFLDLSASNQAWYDAQGLSQSALGKLRFGPHIFPTQKRPLRRTQNGKDIFFGGINDRRRRALDQCRPDRTTVLPDGVYGTQLGQEIDRARAILNIHYAEGVYTEAPRLLTSYLAGKPVVSEKLADPFQAGLHYIDLQNTHSVDEAEIYDNFSHLVTRQLSFSASLKTALQAAL